MLKAAIAMGFRSWSAQGRVSGETSSLCASQARIRQLSPTRPLRIEQSSSYQKQIRERCGDLKPVQVLRQASITHLLKTEDPLDHPKDVLDLGAHAGLTTVGGPDRLINALAPPVTLVGEVLRPSCSGADRRLLSAVRLIAPDPPFLPMQQVLQRKAIGDIRRRGQHRVHQLR